MKDFMNVREELEPPVEVGDILKLGVTGFGGNGDPIMVYQHFIIFLKEKEKVKILLNTLIEIRIIKVLPNFAFAERV